MPVRGDRPAGTSADSWLMQTNVVKAARIFLG